MFVLGGREVGAYLLGKFAVSIALKEWRVKIPCRRSDTFVGQVREVRGVHATCQPTWMDANTRSVSAGQGTITRRLT